MQAANGSGRGGLQAGPPRPSYFFFDDERFVAPERERELLLRAVPRLLVERFEAVLRARLDLGALVPVRRLLPVLDRELELFRVEVAFGARRFVAVDFFAVVRFAAVFVGLFFAAVFVAPVLRRSLFTVRAATSFARFSLAPRFRADCLMCWY